MTNIFSSITSNLLEVLSNLSDKIFNNKIAQSVPTFKGYQLKHVIKEQNSDNLAGTGIYSNKKGESVFIKYVRYSIKNSAYKQLYKEYDILKKLSAITKNNKNSVLSFSSPIGIIENKGITAFVTSYLMGNTIARHSNQDKVSIMKKCILELRALSTNKQVKEMQLPMRTKIHVFVSFHISILRLILRQPHLVKKYLSYILPFYNMYLFVHQPKRSLVIAHRDLHSENIITSGKNIYLIDTEVTVLADEETDLAILAKAYLPVVGKEFYTLLNELLPGIKNKKKFIGLSIFYALQIMAISSKDDKFYIAGENYLTRYLPDVRDYLLPHISVVERIHAVGLRILGILNKSNIISSSPIILCYHSVGKSTWRFSIQTTHFEKQLRYLKKTKNIVSLDEITSNPKQKNTIALTFDDGYKNFYTDAFSILKKYKMPATLFVLGDATNANRQQLDNDLPMVSIVEMKELINNNITIGYHTATHSDMRLASNRELEKEIISSKNNLEKQLGQKITYFAYPRGLYSKKIISFVKKAGFSHAFTVNGGSVSKNGFPYKINRISIEGSTTLSEFATLVSPIGAYYEHLFMKSLIVKESVSFSIKILLSDLYRNKINSKNKKTLVKLN